MTISPLGTAVWQQGFELVEGDITDEARLRPVLARVDAVMHFAAHAYVGESVENPRKYFRNNVVAALSLLNCAERCNTLKPNSSKKALTKKVETRWPSTWPRTFRSRSHPGSGKRHWTPSPAKDCAAAAGRSSDSGGRSAEGSNRAGVDRQEQSRRHRLECLDMDAERLEGLKSAVVEALKDLAAKHQRLHRQPAIGLVNGRDLPRCGDL